MKPYVYLIQDLETGKRYIGSRIAKGCDPSDLGVTYFTSSSIVRPLFVANPARFSKVIVATGSVEYIIDLEKKLIDDCGAVFSDDYYNRTSGKAIHPDDRLAGARFEHSKRSQELYASIVDKMHAKTTREQRSKAARDYAESIRGSVLDDKMRKMRSMRTPEGMARVAKASAERAAANPTKMSEMGKKGGSIGGPKGSATTNNQRWKCVQCGMITLVGPLGKHQSRSGHVGKERVV